MKRKNYMSWDTYFMSVAVLSSFRSKDPETQNGACIVDSKYNRIIGMGYNGLPRGLKDNEDYYWNRDDDFVKSHHSYIIHAEENAIVNAISRDLEGAKLYCTQAPCNKCAQTIIQVGIKKVIYLNKKSGNEKHEKMNTVVARMFADAQVECVSYESLQCYDSKFIEELIDEFDETYNQELGGEKKEEFEENEQNKKKEA